MYATIKGIVFHDTLHTGSYSPECSGIAGVVILLQLPNQEYLTTTTNPSGEFIFKDLYLPGNYILYEIVTPQKENQPIPTSLFGPFGYNSLTTPRQYTFSIAQEQVHNDLVINHFYFGHDFLDPFDASPLAYQVDPDGKQLYSLDLVTGNTSLITKLTHPGDYRAMSYNPFDHFIYGYTPTTHQIFKLTPSGFVTLYDIPNLPKKNYTASAISDNGELYLYKSQDLDFYIVNLRYDSPLYMQLVCPTSDAKQSSYEIGFPISPLALQTWAFHPTNHLLYAINSDGCILCIDPLTGIHKPLMTTGTPLARNHTILFDYVGNLYCIFEHSQALYRITLSDHKAVAEVFTTLHTPYLSGGARSNSVPLYLQLGNAPDLSQTNAPGDYSTSLASNGPRHGITNILNFGDTSTEPFHLDPPPFLITDSTYTLEIPVINRTGQDAYLYGWLDLNQNGVFEGAEAIAPITIPNQLDAPYYASLTFTRSSTTPILIGQTYCRLRLTTDLLANTNTDSASLDTRTLGPASDGDVIDFPFNITGLPPSGEDHLYEVCYCNQNTSHTCMLEDPSGGTLHFALLKTPQSGSASVHPSSGKWSYTPAVDYVGEDAFIIRCTSSISTLYTDIHVVISTLLVDLSMRLEPNSREVTPDDIITYSLFLKNTGSVPLTQIIASNLLPFGCYFIPGSVITHDIHTPMTDVGISVSLDPLAPGEESTLSFQCTTSAMLTQIDASCKVEYSYENTIANDRHTRSKSTPIVVTAVHNPELIAEFDTDHLDALSGDVVTFKILLKNTGTLPLKNIRLYPRLASLLSYQNDFHVNDQPVYTNFISGYSLDLLAPHTNVSIHFTAKILDSPSSTTLESLFKIDYDYELARLTQSKSIKSAKHLLKVHHPKLEITKTPNKSSVSLGEIFTYTFTVTNHSDLLASQVVIQDTLPSIFEILEINCDDRLLTSTLTSGLAIGKLPSHSSKTVVVQLKALGRLPQNTSSDSSSTGIFTLNLPQSETLREISVPISSSSDVFVTDAGLHISCHLSTSEATIGEVITYTLHLTNTGTVTLNEVLLQDLLTPELKFMPRSVMIDGQPHTDASIISGINLKDLGVNVSTTVTFEVSVIAKVSKQIDCALSAYYTYGFNSIKPMKTGRTTSNTCSLTLHYVSIEISGNIHQSIAFLNDEICYTLRIQNTGDTPVFNLILRNDSAAYELAESSFKLNDKLINSVDLNQGINMGSLSPSNTLMISYAQKISEHYYPLDNLSSTLMTQFSYTSHDHTIKYGQSNVLDLAIPLALSTFKQFETSNYFEISDLKPDLETINLISGNIHLLKHYVIKSPVATSIDNQKLTSHNLVFHGILELTAEYVSNEAAHSIYSSYHTLPFSTFIILPEDFPVHSHIHINATLQNVCFKLINNRSFFANASILAIAYIK
ncbi:MAG: DUF6923 family protein [Cellulosilyticaceae bacterium]